MASSVIRVMITDSFVTGQFNTGGEKQAEPKVNKKKKRDATHPAVPNEELRCKSLLVILCPAVANALATQEASVQGFGINFAL